MTFDAGVRLVLDALDADGAALTAAAAAAEEALGVQREALDVLTEGWRGISGSGAVDFVARNCEAAAEIVTALRDAAGVLNTLSEDLGYLLDMRAETSMRGDVLDDAFDRLELVLHAFDRHGGDRGAFDGAQQDAAEGVADGVTEARLEGFGEILRVGGGGGRLLLLEGLGALELSESLGHVCGSVGWVCLAGISGCRIRR